MQWNSYSLFILIKHSIVFIGNYVNQKKSLQDNNNIIWLVFTIYEIYTKCIYIAVIVLSYFIFRLG